MDKFCIANMYKLFGLTYLMEESRNDAISCFNKAIRVFREVKSYHGQASAYYLKSLAVKIKDYEDEYNNVNSEVESRKMAEKAMCFYKLLHHKEGFLKCSSLMDSEENPPNKIVNLEKLQDKNYVPFVERENKLDYISLGIEPIFTSRYEANLDFEVLPEVKRKTTRIVQVDRIKKMNAMRTNMFTDDDIEGMKTTKMPKESKTIEAQQFLKFGTQESSKEDINPRGTCDGESKALKALKTAK